MQPACRWITTENGAFLHWNYACIATVKQRGDHVELCIDWQGHTHSSRAASMAQGVRFVTRWVEAREGLPFVARRRVIHAR